MIKKSLTTVSLIAIMACQVTACNQQSVDKIRRVGLAPEMQEVTIPQEKESAPVHWPVARSKMLQKSTANSLYSPSIKPFFGDQRARKIGDVLMVAIKIKDKAALDNKTERKRDNKDSLGASKLFGLENLLTAWLPGKADTDSLLSVSGSMENKGEGTIEREEEIETDVAAVVRQVLPNGNLVIYGSQEVRVNHEIRQLTVEGVVRPEDISPTNVVQSNRIAEARISYGGEGLISDVQQPRLGSQIVDILSPF